MIGVRVIDFGAFGPDPQAVVSDSCSMVHESYVQHLFLHIVSFEGL